MEQSAKVRTSVHRQPASARHAKAIAAVALAAAAASGTARADGDDSVCHLANLNGLYIFSASGYNIVGGVSVPKAIVEMIHFDGDGTLYTPGVTVSINGAALIQNRPGSPGTYTLGANCIGTVAFSDGPRFDLFLSPKGEDGWMIQTNPNTVMQGNVTRVTR